MDINPDGWAAIVGAFMPFVVSLLKRPEWPAWAKVGVAAIVCLIVGGVTVVVAGDVDLAALHDHPGAILAAAACAFFSATAVYKCWFENWSGNVTLTKFPS
jgi:hypothetical protein